VKRQRRSGGPNWGDFYRNGKPAEEEVIVIEDSPPPQQTSASKTAKSTATGGNAAPTPAYGTRGASTTRPAVTRSQRQGAADVENAQAHPKSRPATRSRRQGSSNIHSGARDSNASLSSASNSQPDSAVQLKRKRTRQTEQPESKRRRVEKADVLAAGCHEYQRPAGPVKRAAEVAVKAVQDPFRHANPKVDDDDGHFIVVPDAMITDRYQIIRLLGQGTFGKVVEAHDRKRDQRVAVKIIRSVQKYRDASRIELRVLASLRANDEENRYRCIHFLDCFDFRGHICLVTDLLGQSVFDFLKGNGFVPFPMSHIQSFARQLFTSVAFIHGLKLIHTDLKPENILLRDHRFQPFTYDKTIPSSSTNVSRTASQRRVLFDTEIRLIDFGSATFDNEYHSSVVSTRHYRAPEIILGLGWSYPCDIWSIGCILVEFFTGDALFQTHDNLEHLAMMERVFGHRIDTSLVQKVNKSSSSSNGASKYFKRLKLDYPKSDTKKSSVKFVRAMKQLEDIIPANNPFMRNFIDLLRKIFVYDPKKRITAEEALNHEWFQDTAYADDGTEAARIRVENEEMRQ